MPQKKLFNHSNNFYRWISKFQTKPKCIFEGKSSRPKFEYRHTINKDDKASIKNISL